MRKALLIAATIALAGCAVEANGNTDAYWQKHSGAPYNGVYSVCIGSDKVFVFDGNRAGGLAVIADHKECVK